MAQQREWQPFATYGILGAIVAFYIAELVVLATADAALFQRLFVIDMHWPFEPWTLITSTLSHSPAGIAHILFNGLVLFFFGPILERLIGWKRFLVLFFLAGAIAGVLQALLQWYLFGQDVGALGASGAIMMVFGALMVVMPKEKILIWGIIPMPFWVAGLLFAAIDVLGAFDPGSGVGNFAHLSGLAIGLWVGWRLRTTMKRRGMHLVFGGR